MTVGGRPASLAAADFDVDGDQDLAVANSNSNDVTILGNNGLGRFRPPPSSPHPTGDSPSSVAAANLDGGFGQDLAIANEASDNVTILRHR